MLRPSITLLVWALLAWMVVALALRLGGGSAAVPAQTPAAALAPAPSLARLFGAAAAPAAEAALPPADSRLRLLGLVAPGDARTAGGVALVSIDGGPPKAFRVGEVVDGSLRLLKVGARSAGLGEKDVVQTELQLQTQPPAAASTGTLAPTLPMTPPAMPNAVPGAPQPPGLPLRRDGEDPGNAEAPRTPGDENPRSRDESGPRRPLPTR